MKRRRAVLLVAILLVASEAQAGVSQLVRDFGGPPLGAKVSALPRPLTREPDCMVTRRYVDCEFRGPGGVHYLVYGELIRKEVRRLRVGPTRWPYGLSGREGPREVAQMLRRRYGIRPEFQRDGSERMVSVVTDPRAPCNLYFTFDDRGLKAASHRCASEAD